MPPRRCVFALLTALVLAASSAGARAAPRDPPPAAAVATADPVTVAVFNDASIHFGPDSTATGAAPAGIVEEEDGRVARVTCRLPELAGPHRITALLTLKPVPKTEREVFDRWDRAGNIRLTFDDGPDLEIVRFMTSYGGRTEHQVDVTHLAPLLRGERTFRAFVDTWVSPAWRVDFSLRYTPVADYDNATWALPVYYTSSFEAGNLPEGASAIVEIPPGLSRVVLRYVSTGHCTDGTDADEFISKANVISVDDVVVARFHPWRDDCRSLRDRNPYCARWTDGSWSCDYSRSGWCPGAEVVPVEFDLTDHLTPGRHTLRFVVEDVRPKDEAGHYGYWRLSAHLAGWASPPRLWRNEE